jgi:hypothetical protein
MKSFIRPFCGRSFQVSDFSFWTTEGIDQTGVSFHFPQKQILPYECLVLFSLPRELLTKLNAFWARLDVQFYAEIKKIYFMGLKSN